jgi:hypothetical protein
VRPPEAGSLDRALRILGAKVRLAPPGTGDVELGREVPVVDSLIEVITRHPLSETELQDALARDLSPQGVARALRRLRADDRAQVVERRGRRFWSSAAYRYAPSR